MRQTRPASESHLLIRSCSGLGDRRVLVASQRTHYTPTSLAGAIRKTIADFAIQPTRLSGVTLRESSNRFRLSHPDRSDNLVRRANARLAESSELQRDRRKIEQNLDLTTEKQSCPHTKRPLLSANIEVLCDFETFVAI